MMLMENAKFETEVLRLLSQLKAKKERLEEQFKAEILSVDAEIEAVSTTARLLRQAHIPTLDGAGTGSSFVKNGLVIPQNLSGKTIKDACLEIAKANNNTLRVKDATVALIVAEVLRPTKNSWGIVNTTLSRSKEFTKHPTARGTYKITEWVGQGKLNVASL